MDIVRKPLSVLLCIFIYNTMKAKAEILNKLLEHLDISVLKFEKNIKVGNTTIDKLLKRNGNISLELIRKIRTKYPQVSEDWLRTGEGQMLLSNPNTPLPVITEDMADRFLSAQGDVLGLFTEFLSGKIRKLDELEKRIEKLEGKG